MKRTALDPDDWREVRGELFYRDLGISGEDERHQLQAAITGCSSLRLMSFEEHAKLLGALKSIAVQPPNEQEATLKGLLLLTEFDYEGET
jgi:hypothetical protein